MTNRDRLEAFRARFQIEADPEAAARFSRRLAHAAKESISPLEYRVRYLLESEFAFRNASMLSTGRTPLGDPRITHGILEELEKAKGFSSVVERAQHLLWAFEASGYRLERSGNAGSTFAARLAQAIELSPGIDLRLENAAGQLELAPAGVPLLDSAVDRAIQWLGRYPDVQKEYRQALTILVIIDLTHQPEKAYIPSATFR